MFSYPDLTVAQIMAVLPDFPEWTDEDDPEARELVLKQEDEPPVMIHGPVSRADAREYCSREDTHDGNWMIFFERYGNHMTLADLGYDDEGNPR